MTACPRENCNRRSTAYAALTTLLWSLTSITMMLSVFRDKLQAYYGITKDQYGLLLSISAIPGIAGGLLGGVAVDRLGAKTVLRVSLAGCAASLGVAACPGPWTLLLVAVGMLSLFVQPLGIAATAYMVELFPSNRRRVLTLSLVGMSVCAMVFPLLAEGLLKLHAARPAVTFGQIMRIPLAVTAGVLLLGVLLYRGRSSTARGTVEPEKPREPAKGPLDAGSLLLVALLVMHGTCDTAAYMWMSSVLGNEHCYGRHVFLPGAVMAAFSLAYVVSRSILSMLPERWGANAMMIAPGLLGGTVLLSGILSRDQAWTSIAYVTAGFCWSVEYPTFLSTLANTTTRFGTALAVQAVAGGLALFVMVYVMGIIAQALGDAALWKILLIPACGFPLVGLGGAIWVWRFRPAKQPAEQLAS